MGLLFVACGVPPILIGLGVLTPSNLDPTTPSWVAVCAGLMFAVAGLLIILDFAIGHGIGPDGDFQPGTPFAVRLANFLLGMTIVGLMISVFGWVSFGSGPRRFTSTLWLPFMTRHWVSGELSGRIVFGAATVLMVVMFVACTAVGIERLRRARNQ
jgi:hypothetical protein